MSYSTMYVAGPSGDLEPEHEYRNGWGSAPCVWDALCEKYEVWQLDKDGTRPEDAWHKRKPEFFNWLHDGLQPLFNFQTNGGEMRPWEHNCLLWTADNIVIERADFATLAASLRMFEQAHARPLRVCHLGAVADHLDDLLKGEARAIAFLHTSVSEFWGNAKAWQRYVAEHGEEPDEYPAYNIDRMDDHETPPLLTPAIGPYQPLRTPDVRDSANETDPSQNGR